MAANTKFSAAVHVLSVLARYGKDELLTSDLIAGSLGTNPVVVRRMLADLKRAGIVETQAGQQGGLRLARAAEKISLMEIYRAVEPNRWASVHRNPVNKKCQVSRGIKQVLDGVLDDAESALMRSLAEKSLAQVTQQIE